MLTLNGENVERKFRVLVGDYKFCVGQKSDMEFNLSSIIAAWGSSVDSSDTSVVRVRKQGYTTNYATFSFDAISTGIATITISEKSNVLKRFTVVVQNHSLAYFEQVDSTCSKEGSIAHYRCLFCDMCFSESGGQQSIDDVSIDKIEHKYVISQMKENTCSEDGYVKYVCQNCLDTYAEQLEAGHVYESKIVRADCENEGYTISTCSRCGNSYKTSYVEMLGHNYDLVSYMNDNSIIKKKCTRCGNATYEMNINGTLIDGRFYQVYWKENESDYYVPLNQECSVASSFDSSMNVSVYVKYKQPIRSLSGKLKIYDIKMLYEDMDTKQVRYDDAINCISFSYFDVYANNQLEGETGYGVSQCELNMHYYKKGENNDGYFRYIYDSIQKVRDKRYKILGVTFKLKFESADSSPYSKKPVQEVKLSQNKLTIAKGFSKKIKVIYNTNSEYINGSLEWKSSNKKIATINKSGKITAKKTGKCTITCTLPNGKKAECKVTVVKNKYKGKKLSQCDAHAGRYGNIHFEVSNAYYKGNKFILKCVVMNTRVFRADRFNWIKIVAEDYDGNVIAKKKFKNVPINLGAYGKKYITFTFPKSTVKKKRELYKEVRIDTDYNYQYSY